MHASSIKLRQLISSFINSALLDNKRKRLRVLKSDKIVYVCSVAVAVEPACGFGCKGIVVVLLVVAAAVLPLPHPGQVPEIAQIPKRVDIQGQREQGQFNFTSTCRSPSCQKIACHGSRPSNGDHCLTRNRLRSRLSCRPSSLHRWMTHPHDLH